jgi:hypothetical protein
VADIKSIVWSEINARAAAYASVALADAGGLRFAPCITSLEVTDPQIHKNAPFNAASPSQDAFFNSAPVLLHAGIVLEDSRELADIGAPHNRVLQLHVLQLHVSPSQTEWSPERMHSPQNIRALEILGRHLGTAGCQRLADEIVHNTSMTSLNLHCSQVGAAGASVLLPALAQLPSLTLLCLSGTSLQSAGALHLCSALPHLTALTELDVGYNELTADDAARICSVAASAGMTRLKTLYVLSFLP